MIKGADTDRGRPKRWEGKHIEEMAVCRCHWFGFKYVDSGKGTIAVGKYSCLS